MSCASFVAISLPDAVMTAWDPSSSICFRFCGAMGATSDFYRSDGLGTATAKVARRLLSSKNERRWCLGAGHKVGSESIADRVGNDLDRVVFRIAPGTLAGETLL